MSVQNSNTIRAGLIVWCMIIPALFGFYHCAGAQDRNTAKVSGTLVGGFRVLQVADLARSPEVFVFRGDYIKFDLAGIPPARLSIPALDIGRVLEGDLARAPYFKMKRAGVFDFSIGDRAATLTVMEYSGAHYSAVSAEEARKVIQTFSPLILDVRTPREFQGGHLENVRLIPVQQLQARADELDPYKDEPILIYCATGNRSTVASKILIDRGFTRIFNLRYGIVDWVRKQHPVVK